MPYENPSPRPVILRTAQQNRKIAETARRILEDPTQMELGKEERASLYRVVLIAESLARTMADREAEEQQVREPQPERDNSNDQP